VALKLTNSGDAKRTVILEPWAGEYVLGPGRSYEIIAEGDLGRPLEIEFDNETVTVYSFDSEGALLTIFENGKELKAL